MRHRSSKGVQSKRADVLVIGSGVAGLRCSLAASQHGRVILTCKDSLDVSNSQYAQGGIAIPVDNDDDVAAHIDDTITTGCGLSDRTVVAFVIGRARHALDELRSWGVAFDDCDGELSLGREGGHSRNRIVHAGGDSTGKALSDVLTDRVRATDSIEVCEHVFITDLIVNGRRCVGAIGLTESNERLRFLANRTVIASGGAGDLFLKTTNPPGATADGWAIALRAGASVRDLEFMQFHPTALLTSSPRHPLISEAVRGEGGLLVDRNGRRFMEQYHPMAELAPRDVVSRAICQEMKKSDGMPMNIDVRHLPSGLFAKRFPRIDKACRDHGFDPARELIPICPAAHYAIGGIKVDLDGRSTLDGLLACGEAASTGMHGANRLASNSLLEALVLGEVTGNTAGRDAAAGPELSAILPIHRLKLAIRDETTLLEESKRQIQELLWRFCGVERDCEGLERAAEVLSSFTMSNEEASGETRATREFANIHLVARAIVAAALTRTESRGVHFRRDFPELDDANWRRRIELGLSPTGDLTSYVCDGDCFRVRPRADQRR